MNNGKIVKGTGGGVENGQPLRQFLLLLLCRRSCATDAADHDSPKSSFAPTSVHVDRYEGLPTDCRQCKTLDTKDCRQIVDTVKV